MNKLLALADRTYAKRPPILENDRTLVPRPLRIIGKRLRARAHGGGED